MDGIKKNILCIYSQLQIEVSEMVFHGPKTV